MLGPYDQFEAMTLQHEHLDEHFLVLVQRDDDVEDEVVHELVVQQKD
jgi:hypothetical protein